MRMEHLILVAMWLFGILASILFIPAKDRRKGFFAFLMFQAIIWLCDMPSFKYGLFSAPVRELPKATDLPLTIDYFFYPVWFAIFYVHKRIQANLWSRMTYFFVWVSVITIFDIVLERYTDLIEYETVAWYGIWIYIMILFFVSQVCCDWFFKDQTLFQAELEQANEN